MSRSKNLLIFFVKYLVISKKSSTFAPDFGVKRLKLLELFETI